MDTSSENFLSLLREKSIRLTLVSPDNQWQLTYESKKVAKDKEDPTQASNMYFLLNLKSGQVLANPWDDQLVNDFATKHAGILATACSVAGYKLINIERGWEMTCSKCHVTTSDAIYRNVPKNCPACGFQFGVQS